MNGRPMEGASINVVYWWGYCQCCLKKEHQAQKLVSYYVPGRFSKLGRFGRLAKNGKRVSRPPATWGRRGRP